MAELVGLGCPADLAKAATGLVGGRRRAGATMSSDELQKVVVTAGPSPTVLGATVNAVITITGDPDRRVRGARAELVRTAIHRVTRTNVTDHGSHDSLLQEEVVIAEAPIISSGEKVVPGEHAVSLRIPPDGPRRRTVRCGGRSGRSSTGGTAPTSGRKHRSRCSQARSASRARQPPKSATRASAASTLSFPPARCRPGQTITGGVILRPERAMTVTEVVVLFVVTLPAKKGLRGQRGGSPDAAR